MDEKNYPYIKHDIGYTGYSSGYESMVFMSNNEDIATAFKLRWL